MTRTQAARARSLVIRGVEAYQARNLKLAVAAFTTAGEETQGGPKTISAALSAAAAAARRDDRRALMAAVAKTAPLADYDEAPPAPMPAEPALALIATALPAAKAPVETKADDQPPVVPLPLEPQAETPMKSDPDSRTALLLGTAGQTLAIHRLEGDAHPGDLAADLARRGDEALQREDFAEAEHHFRDALNIFERAGRPGQETAAQCLEGLAVLQTRRGTLEPARALLRDAVARMRGLHGPDHPLVLRLEAQLAFVSLSIGDLPAAAALARAVLRRMRPGLQEALRRDLWYLLSLLAAARQETAAAILFGKFAAHALHRQSGGAAPQETLPHRLFAARPGDMFRHLARLLAASDRLAEASQALAMLKQDELFDMLGRDPSTDPRHGAMALNDAEAAWQAQGSLVMRPILDDEADNPLPPARRRAETAFFEAWMDSAEALCGSVQAAPAAKHPGLASLGARAGILRLLPGPASLHLLLTTTEFTIRREVQVTAPVLRRLVWEFRAAIAARRDDVPALGATLYRHLIAPIADPYRERGITTLLIGAEGWLRYLPFAALHDGTQYLAETTATALLTEAAPDTVHGSQRPSTIASFGTAGTDDGLRSLERVVLDQAFDKANLSTGLSRHGLVHIASDVALDAGQPSESALRLGDGSTLRLNALASPPYDLRHVTLMAFTACKTVTGDDGTGGEIEALGALPRWRGAQAVLATLWRPAEGPTATIMAPFYSQLRGGKPASRALNTAQRALLAGPASHQHPYHWAGFFVMSGVE
jgi:CHAT domain-containing protein